MAKSKSVRKSAKAKKRNAIKGARVHKLNMYKHSVKKFKKVLDDFQRRQEIIRQHRENTLAFQQDAVYSSITPFSVEEE